MKVQEKSYIDKLHSYRLYSKVRIAENFALSIDRAKLYDYSAFIEEMQGNIEQAMKDYEVAIKLDPYYIEAYNNNALLLYRQRSEVAFGLFTKAIMYCDDKDWKVKILNNRGNYFQEILKEYEVAEEDYNLAIELDPNFAETYYNRGICYYRQKKAWDDRWQKDWDKAHELNKNLKWIDIGNE